MFRIKLLNFHFRVAKLCRRQKVSTERPYYIKHYRDGVFHKDYDRSETVKSITGFLRDPTGSLPWEEDATAIDVIHLDDTMVSKLCSVL